MNDFENGNLMKYDSVDYCQATLSRIYYNLLNRKKCAKDKNVDLDT